MAPKYVLNYFPLTGRGETIRYLFHVAGVEFTDNHVTFEDWPKIKTDARRFPLGQMPTLEVDDKVICQSMAIARFVANELGMNGKTNYEKALIDEICEALVDFGNIVIPQIFGANKPDKLDFGEKGKTIFTFVTNYLKSNNGGSGYLVGDKISLADCMFLALSDMLSKYAEFTSFMEQFPELRALSTRVENNEAIKKYKSSRKY